MIPPPHCPRRYLRNINESHGCNQTEYQPQPHTLKQIETRQTSVESRIHDRHGLQLSSALHQLLLHTSFQPQCGVLTLTPAVLIAVLQPQPYQLQKPHIKQTRDALREQIQENDQTAVVRLARRTPIPWMSTIRSRPTNKLTIGSEFQAISIKH